ncbi:ABC transporter substrate-binding protein [Cellulomonas xylanilytica]|uniref:Iron-siderophore ABC transporter substrate-binding protein n=1 Tax=Cellulomonas xylanilytica TaxID=233583 RepID=A0A510V049_9CELL|nr:ABC transporter substrate-binding protein [Cellulomonas xylanilytica]GEK20284.1 iron-siderophore ABC transporter substrate-binding protein [Cellulomonas xylanilytica]
MRIARRAAAVASASAVALTLAACAGGADDPAAEPTSSGSATSDDIFPVSIDSTLGTADIEAKPERVVTLGWGAADIALSLGTVPVGIEEDTWGGDADGYQPWFRDAVEAEGAELPETIAMYPELDVDAIIALEPDLVLAPQSGLEQDVFDQLSAFVPVVAYPGAPWQTSLEDQVTIAAEALGVPEKADALLEERQTAIDAAAAEHPELAGLSFAYVYGGDQPGALSVYLPGDPRVELLTGLGLELAPSVSALSASPGTFVSTLGLENADQLNDADLLFTWFNSADEQAATEAQPLWAQIPAFASGAYVPMLDPQLGMAVSVATPLSVPWAIDAYVPLITAGAEKVQG